MPTELAIALIDWGLYTYKLPKIIAPVHPGNERSIRVLEKGRNETPRNNPS